MASKAELLVRMQRLSEGIGKFEREHKALPPTMKPAHLAAIESLKKQLEECSRAISKLSWTM